VRLLPGSSRTTRQMINPSGASQNGAVRPDIFQYSLEYRNILDLAIGKEQVRAQPQRNDSNVTDTRHVEVTNTTVESLVVVAQAALRELPPGADS